MPLEMAEGAEQIPGTVGSEPNVCTNPVIKFYLALSSICKEFFLGAPGPSVQEYIISVTNFLWVGYLTTAMVGTLFRVSALKIELFGISAFWWAMFGHSVNIVVNAHYIFERASDFYYENSENPADSPRPTAFRRPLFLKVAILFFGLYIPLFSQLADNVYMMYKSATTPTRCQCLDMARGGFNFSRLQIEIVTTGIMASVAEMFLAEASDGDGTFGQNDLRGILEGAFVMTIASINDALTVNGKSLGERRMHELPDPSIQLFGWKYFEHYVAYNAKVAMTMLFYISLGVQGTRLAPYAFGMLAVQFVVHYFLFAVVYREDFQLRFGRVCRGSSFHQFVLNLLLISMSYFSRTHMLERYYNSRKRCLVFHITNLVVVLAQVLIVYFLVGKYEIKLAAFILLGIHFIGFLIGIRVAFLMPDQIDEEVSEQVKEDWRKRAWREGWMEEEGLFVVSLEQTGTSSGC